jgi:hypothetical protein
MAKRALPQATPGAERLGSPTIMERALAVKHGVPYVHLTVFAIDVDRVRVATEDQTDELPFGWEVFLTECYLLEEIDPQAEGTAALIEDILLGVLELPPGQEVLGTQLPFAVWHAVRSQGWPSTLAHALSGWKARPEPLGKDLDALFSARDRRRAELARTCLAVSLSPGLAAPTEQVLRRWAGSDADARPEGLSRPDENR